MLTGNNITDPRPDDTIKVMRRNGLFGDLSLATLIAQFPSNVANLYVSNTLTVGGAASLGPTTVTSMYNEGNETIVGTLNVTGNTTLGTVTGGAASFSSLVVSGTLSAATQPLGDNSTAVATTAFVKGQNYATQPWVISQGYATQGWVTSQNYATQTWVQGQAYITASALTPYAPLNSPAFTGTPTAPTPPGGDASTRIATTAFVSAATGGTGAAPINSPNFTGNPTTPTPPAADNSTSIANTSWVQSQNYATQSWVTAQGYATQGWVTSQAYAPIASPTFTGVPKAPTPATADNSVAIATTAFVKAQNYITAAALSPYAPLASPTFTGIVTSTGFLGDTFNTGTFPSTGVSGIFFSWNHTQAQGEGDLWNTYAAGGNPSFNFYQMTAAGAATLVASLGLTGASFPTGATTVTQAYADGAAGQTNIATDAFVWGHGIASSGQLSINSATTLSDAHAGHNILCSGTFTITFPTTSRTFILSNIGTGIITIQTTAGTDYSTSFFPGQTVVLCGDGTGFFRVIATGHVGNSGNAPVPSWTPTMTFGGASVGVTYGQQVGYFQLEGRYMTVSWGLTLSSKGTSTGQAAIGGFPAPASDGWGWAACGSLNLVGMSGPPLVCVGSNAQAIIYMSNTGGIANVTDANIANNSIINGTLRYRI